MNPPAPAPGSGLSPTPAVPSAARCRHFGDCGGCARQDLAYEAQVALKADELGALLAGHAAVLEPVVPAASPWYYRNKMEFAFGLDGDRIGLGLRRKGRFFGVVSLAECFLMSEAVAPMLAAARDWATERSLVPYHLRKHAGLLRYLVIREGKRSGDRLVMLVTATPPDEAAFGEALEDLDRRLAPLGATSLLWVVTDRQADLAVGEVRRVVRGRAGFAERLGGVDFDLSPFAFFQPNVEMMDRLIERARGFLGTGWDMVLDLYCGVGGLTLTLAAAAGKRAIGVEVEGPAVEDAKRTAARLNRPQVSFVAEDALDFVRRFSNHSFLADRWAVLLDPPRGGMHPKMTAQLLRVAPPVIVYVSCNPKKLAEDLGVLGHDYRLEAAVPFDFFPHTPHVEVLAKLVRR